MFTTISKELSRRKTLSSINIEYKVDLIIIRVVNVNLQCCVIVTLPGKSFSDSRKANNYEQNGTCGQV